MSAPANSMSPAWCYTRVAEARALVDALPQGPARTHLIQLLSILDRPPVADWQALADAARLLEGHAYGASDKAWRTYRALATPANILALLRLLPAPAPEATGATLAPERLLLVGDATMGCDAWQWVQAVDADSAGLAEAVAGNVLTAPVAYVRADVNQLAALDAATARAEAAEAQVAGLQGHIGQLGQDNMRLIDETHRWSAAEKRDKLRHQEEMAGLRRELHRVADFAEGYHPDDPGLFHGMQVEVPSLCRAAAGMPAAPVVADELAWLEAQFGGPPVRSNPRTACNLPEPAATSTVAGPPAASWTPVAGATVFADGPPVEAAPNPYAMPELARQVRAMAQQVGYGTSAHAHHAADDGPEAAAAPQPLQGERGEVGRG